MTSFHIGELLWILFLLVNWRRILTVAHSNGGFFRQPNSAPDRNRARDK